MILIAHKEDCAVILYGWTRIYEKVDADTGEPFQTAVPQSCTCGGVKVELEMEPTASGSFKPVVRVMALTLLALW